MLVLLAALAAGGCGDDNETPAASTPTVTTLQTPTQTTTQAAKPAKPDALDDVALRLTRGGYTVAALDVSPPAVAARRVGSNILLYTYNTTDAAKAGADVITKAIRKNPKRGLLDVEERRVWFIGATHDITAAERAAFSDLVDVGEGRKSP